MSNKKIVFKTSYLTMFTVLIFATSFIFGCLHESPSDITLKELIAEQHLDSDPLNDVVHKDIRNPVVQLGKKLFYTMSLGGEEDSACVSCHHPMLGGGDQLPLSIGIHATEPHLLGVGRTTKQNTPPLVPRQALTTFNIALWKQALFWDGRVEVHGVDTTTGSPIINTPDGSPDQSANVDILHAQAAFPVTSQEEMRGNFKAGEPNDALRLHLAKRLADTPEGGDLPLSFSHWEQEFRSAFDMPLEPIEEVITFRHIQTALSDFQRTMIFLEHPWRQYLNGDLNAMTKQQKQGAILFYTNKQDGGAGCSACHNGALLSDEQFYPLGFPQIGRGKGDGLPDALGNTDDYGRYRVTGVTTDMYKFRTPSLLNIAHTAPYGHSGNFATLEEVIRYSAKPDQEFILFFNETRWCQFEQFSSLSGCIDLFPSAQTFTQHSIDARKVFEEQHQISVELSNEEISKIKSFLEALTDPCLLTRECMQPWIYEAPITEDPDENMLRAVDRNGKLL
ncbi:cytochrome-c peroxidase [Vibrio gallaecicus]|uniref:cytochrome-c peroxidase n=1 Tax=Vibrio gallaecicus TaxID=552386 RepID=UPI00142E2598|nr:cytochrome c peroxidase [Vibrio gallaecicus]MDN3617566.1 cytochrome c peroxidase [Vibrio gallaecicus]